MPRRKTRSTESWKASSWATSRKSDSQPSGSVPLCPLGLVTLMSLSVPAGRAGAVASSWVAFGTVTAVAGTPPNVAAAPERKFAPLRVIPAPPTEGPEAGAALEATGAPGGGGVAVGVRVGVREGVLLGVRLGVRLGVFGARGVAVSVGVNVAVGVIEGVKVGVGVGIPLPTEINSTAAAAQV